MRPARRSTTATRAPLRRARCVKSSRSAKRSSASGARDPQGGATLVKFLERRRTAAFSGAVEAARRELVVESANALLDVGGGSGAITAQVARGIPRIVVLEPRGASRAEGQKRRPGIEFVEGTAER